MTTSSEYPESSGLVALNDPVDLVRLLVDGTLFRALNQQRTLAASCGTDCTCNDSMCTCRHSRTAVEAELMSPSELESMRAERIEQLRRQLAEVERQLAEVEDERSPEQSTSGKAS
jgi:hypothetical protein